jgi:RNA polymerase sigma-70 factor (ECF subfamily)
VQDLDDADEHAGASALSPPRARDRLALGAGAEHDGAKGAWRSLGRRNPGARLRLAQTDPDEALLARVAEGDPAAVRAMVARKLPRLISLAQRMLGDAGEAEDVAQEAFLRIWKQAGRWRPGQAKFDTWLHRVALNLCYDRLRRRREVATDQPPEQVDTGPAPDRGLEAADVASRVSTALQALPERQREAIVLCHYQELGNIEAAAIMGVSVEALESLLSRGRRALRAALADMVER